MNLASIASLRSTATPQPPTAKPPTASPGSAGDVEKARGVQKAFTQFVGETFYGQMIKSMRATVGEPAYFHGGMAEEQFQSRLDQQLSTSLASGRGGSDLAQSLFEHQFPAEAATLRAADEGLSALDTLRRR